MASIGNQSATATTFEIAGKITGSGSVMRSSPAITGSIVRFSNDANDYTGDFKAGNQFTEFTSVANAGVASALGAGSTAYATSFGANNSGSILRYVGFGNSSTNRAIDWQSTTAYLNVSNTGSGSVQYLASGTLKSLSGSAGFSLDGTNTGANVFAQVINDNGGITTLTKSGAGTWSVMGTNTYTGVTTLSAGTLGVGSIGNGGVAGNLGQATNAAGNLVFNGGTLLYTGASATSDRAFTINAGKTAVINTTHHLTLAGATGTGTNGALTKLGAGTLTLTGANTYTGATLISGGTLALGASGTIDDTSEVSLGTVGTFDVSAKSLGYTVATLKGSGNVTGALTVSTQLAIGNSPGTTHFSGNLTLDSATYVYELTSGASPGVGSADLGNVAGDLTIIGGSILDLVELGTYTAGNKFTLFGYGTLSGTFDGLADGATFTDAGGIWMIDYDDGTAGANGGTGTGFVTITAVPEPNAASLLGGLGILALMRRRR
jgi:autotransporter-associated beta strand protein